MEGAMSGLKNMIAERKMVQERAVSGEDPPPQYILEESHRPIDDPQPTFPVPVVHLGHSDETAEIKAALQSWGMFQVVAKSLELDKDFFSTHLGDKSRLNARFNYYPSCSRPDLVFGLKPHSDATLITVILPDKDVEGLQVMKDGKWFKVTTSPHALLLNIGDQMEIMSNGIFKSPVHRVVTNPDNERISVAMLCSNELDKEIGPADDLVNEMRPRLYKSFKMKDYLEVIDHGLSSSFLDEIRDIARTFFNLPMEEKQKYSNLIDGEGYGNDNIIEEGHILDWNDRLYLLVQPEDERKLELWPVNPSSFRDVLHEYTIKTRKLINCILKVVAKSLELDKDFFSSHLGDRSRLNARFNYYPSCSRHDLVFGLKPHSDSTLITVILPDKDVEGLQVMKDGKWFKVTTSPHALLLNIGDQMEIMSNGIFKSPVHRVVTNPDNERISVAMFCSNECEKVIGPADDLVNEMRPRLYKSFKMKDYLEVFVPRFFQGKRAIDWAKL
ncbi:hypothetical protein J5N97_003138 [Dioscorea zingiberensis]|uniref:Fe2OG dioxygenase domain-containing protein n=1 Tax=Dioscorea zingiberensis TaxID=325984 RepID=A0A9D5HR12_9LILI|nr:hypothetical protein J5N97_003138 [Dioscorea zingiberensis]